MAEYLEVYDLTELVSHFNTEILPQLRPATTQEIMEAFAEYFSEKGLKVIRLGGSTPQEEPIEETGGVPAPEAPTDDPEEDYTEEEQLPEPTPPPPPPELPRGMRATEGFADRMKESVERAEEEAKKKQAPRIKKRSLLEALRAGKKAQDEV